jgi:hypothetical protein
MLASGCLPGHKLISTDASTQLLYISALLPQAKKVAQHLKKHKMTGTGYTNDDNPFGDANLTERFVWGKKIEKEISSGRDVREMTARAEAKRQAERLVGANVELHAWLMSVCCLAVVAGLVILFGTLAAWGSGIGSHACQDASKAGLLAGNAASRCGLRMVLSLQQAGSLPSGILGTGAAGAAGVADSAAAGACVSMTTGLSVLPAGGDRKGEEAA